MMSSKSDQVHEAGASKNGSVILARQKYFAYWENKKRWFDEYCTKAESLMLETFYKAAESGASSCTITDAWISTGPYAGAILKIYYVGGDGMRREKHVEVAGWNECNIQDRKKVQNSLIDRLREHGYEIPDNEKGDSFFIVRWVDDMPVMKW